MLKSDPNNTNLDSINILKGEKQRLRYKDAGIVYFKLILIKKYLNRISLNFAKI